MCKQSIGFDIEQFAAGGKFSLAELGSELAMLAREFAEQVEALETGLMIRLDLADAPNTHESFEVLRKRAGVLGQAVELITKLRVRHA